MPSRRNARPGFAATDDRKVCAERGERFCRRQANAIGGTCDQDDLLVLHDTAIQGSGRADDLLDYIRPQARERDQPDDVIKSAARE
jgi:hypothetical protein